MVKHITIETILDLYITITPQSLGIADLGCSSGPNTLSAIKEIINAVKGSSRKNQLPAPEFRVTLNDLPSNDFNSIFKALPDLYKELDNGTNSMRPHVFISAVPGSFYGRLFPSNSLHFVHSSYSMHWLSKVCFSHFTAFIIFVIVKIWVSWNEIVGTATAVWRRREVSKQRESVYIWRELSHGMWGLLVPIPRWLCIVSQIKIWRDDSRRTYGFDLSWKGRTRSLWQRKLFLLGTAVSLLANYGISGIMCFYVDLHG